MDADLPNFEPAVRSNAVCVSHGTKRALIYLAFAQGRTADSIAEEMLAGQLAALHPQVVEFIAQRERSEKEFKTELRENYQSPNHQSP